MAARKFRAEFLRDKRDKGWVHERPISIGDVGAPTFEVVFRDTADGKHYAMHYYRDLDVGVCKFDGADDDDVYECYEVEKKKTVTTEWVKK